MDSFKKMIVFTFSFLFLHCSVSAATCGYEEKAKLNNEIANVKASYEIKERILDKSEYGVPGIYIGTEFEDTYEAKTDYIEASVLNITENMYLDIVDDYNKERKIYSYNDSKDGKVTFEWHDIKQMVTFKIKVYASSNTGCEGTLLKTISLKLPRFNEFSDYSICNNFPDYYLCQRYVTYEEVSYSTFFTNMTEEAEKKYQEELEKEKEKDKWYNKLGKFISDHKVAFIVGGVVLIVAGGGTAFIIIERRRRSII